jgi:predicted Ser/Thr protein kinase
MGEEDFHKRDTQPGFAQGKKADAGFDATPKMIGPYKIECLLEKGGMSYLFLGIHPETKALTTIKVLSPRYLSHPEAVEHFLNEAEIIAMADHPNIVKLYGHGKWEGGLYIAMEYIQGLSLRQVLLENPISLKRALEIVIDIAYALCHLHTHGVIHRDLKPENILITEQEQVKVIDFGIAQLLTEKNSAETRAQQRLIGTPIYMSPEQRENPESVSYPSDVYSLGIITYELVLGKLSHGQIHLPLMPKGIQKILSKALQQDPKARYQDMVDFITDLSAYLHSANLDKEKKAGDQLSEFSENLRHVRELLLSHKPDNWLGVEIGTAIHQGVDLGKCSYCDFLSSEAGRYGIIQIQSSAKGAEGMVYISILRGMVHTLKTKTRSPTEMALELNQLIVKDQMECFFTLNYLLLSFPQNQVDYICCGQGYLWHMPATEQKLRLIPCSNPALGIVQGKDAQPNQEEESEPRRPFTEAAFVWGPGDFLLFCPEMPENIQESSIFESLCAKVFEENPGAETQYLADALLRKIKFSIEGPPLLKSFTLFLLKNSQSL